MLRCQALTKRGQPCRRPALAGHTACTLHIQPGALDDEEAFYGAHLDPDELRALARAAGLDGLNRELAVMRVLARRVVSATDVDAARRAIEAVARLVQIKHNLDIAQASQITTSLDQVLDTLAEELGAPL